MIVVVANGKGGVGKTTTSVFLAHALAAATGAPCTLIDADPQASATDWSRLAAEAGTPLRSIVRSHPAATLGAYASSAANVVIDTPPDEGPIVAAAVELADIVLIPTTPSALDLSVTARTFERVTAAGARSAVLLTRTRRTLSVAGAEQTLRDLGAHLLRTHVPLRESLATAYGRPVRDLHGYDLAIAELLGALPERPYSLEAVRARSARAERTAVPPISLRPHVSQRPATIGFDDDDLVQRLKKSVARLAT